MDRSDAARAAVALALALAPDGALLTLLHALGTPVVPPVAEASAWSRAAVREEETARAWLGELARVAPGARQVLVRGPTAREAAAAQLAAQPPDLTVVSGDPAGAAEALAADARRPLLAVRGRVTVPPTRIAVCVDGSEGGEAALALALGLRARTGPVRLLLVRVAVAPRLVGYSRWGPERQAFFRRARRELRVRAEGVTGAEQVVLWGPPGPALVRWAEADEPDLLVCGRHARRGVIDPGGVPRALVAGAPCPVLVVPPGPVAPAVSGAAVAVPADSVRLEAGGRVLGANGSPLEPSRSAPWELVAAACLRELAEALAPASVHGLATMDDGRLVLRMAAPVGASGGEAAHAARLRAAAAGPVLSGLRRPARIEWR